ncbi:hypothetical protein ASPFODRAFT_337363 [Aspergillus luchuensis CBS 106.47]|uniref:FAD-binding domain-containing protein n=1 Tax=Aspergillus luchuensis (strain CBS 106.47) TaxID=1137211 RepID=A0A1M3T7Z1_ASPLC|nr:hypothetical protein ASPFODRAFT_337363 [Aspergillus luchuensis CBS 106.47]
MERSGMLRILHNHIADPRKLHSQSPVVAYEETPEGITVTTADGQTFPGSILIGADGIHSRVRQLMADKIRAFYLAYVGFVGMFLFSFLLLGSKI